MKAIILRELGAAENLKLEDAPDPQPGAGEAVVRLKAAALNHRDVFIWQRLYPNIKLPAILGSDGAGVVASVGEGVDQSLIGREVVIEPGLDWGPSDEAQGKNYRILGMPEDGTYAEMIKIPAENLHPKPAYLTFEEAAALPLAGLTAYRCSPRRSPNNSARASSSLRAATTNWLAPVNSASKAARITRTLIGAR